MGFPGLPGLQMVRASSNPSGAWKWCVNKSGAGMDGGDLVIWDSTPANNALGKRVPVTTISAAGSELVMGAVRDGAGNVADGSDILIQLGGFHPGVNVDNTGGALTEGDSIGSSNTLTVGSKGTYKVGRYCDADYNSATVAAKKMMLINPQGLQADRD